MHRPPDRHWQRIKSDPYRTEQVMEVLAPLSRGL
jgi:hypothetical protein